MNTKGRRTKRFVLVDGGQIPNLQSDKQSKNGLDTQLYSSEGATIVSMQVSMDQIAGDVFVLERRKRTPPNRPWLLSSPLKTYVYRDRAEQAAWSRNASIYYEYRAVRYRRTEGGV